MGLAWQQGPLAPGSVGRFLVPDPLPQRLLFAEPLRRRMRVRFAQTWIAQSDDVWLLHEPGRYPVAYFPKRDSMQGVLVPSERTTEHRDLGPTAWYAVEVGERRADRAAWEHTALPGYAKMLGDRVAFGWRAMDGFYEEDEQIVGHAADAYHRIDIRRTSRHLIVRAGERPVAESHRPRGGWSYREPYREVERIAEMVSFEPDLVTVELDGAVQHLAPGQTVVPHGPDRNLTIDELRGDAQGAAAAQA
jgi:uncharacterized protein (DUF427 family)